VDAVPHTRRDVRDASGADLYALIRHTEPGPIRNHVVGLVFGVRILIIDRLRRLVRDGQAKRGRKNSAKSCRSVSEPGEQLLGAKGVHRLQYPQIPKRIYRTRPLVAAQPILPSKVAVKRHIYKSELRAVRH
jgi:hypothetical protein